MFGYVLEIEEEKLFSQDLNVLFLDYLSEFRVILYLSPSDYSVFHSRLTLIKMLKKTLASKLSLWDEFVLKEFELIDDLLLRYPFYTTTWNYCKYFLLITKLEENSLNFKETLNKELNKSLENLFFKQNCTQFYLVENESLIKRYINLAETIATLFKLDNREHFMYVEKLSQNFIQFLNKFVL